jgi:hypothetical protein
MVLPVEELVKYRYQDPWIFGPQKKKKKKNPRYLNVLVEKLKMGFTFSKQIFTCLLELLHSIFCVKDQKEVLKLRILFIYHGLKWYL